jgi:hypothetical protein
MASTQCLRCARSRGDGTCAAFPKGIPEEIWQGIHDHRNPYPNDGGLRFEERTGTADDLKKAYPPDGIPEELR